MMSNEGKTMTSAEGTPAFSRLETITAVAVLGVLALALGLTALVLPSTTTKTAKLHYTQSIRFAYSADARSGSAYGDEGLRTGQPVLLRQVGPVTVTASYRLVTNSPVRITGTAGMRAVVKTGQGFSRSFPMAADSEFTGGHGQASGRLPVKQLRGFIASLGDGLADGVSTATVVVQPHFKVSGELDGHAIRAGYGPELIFGLTGDTLSLGDPTGVAGSSNDRLHPAKKGSVSYQQLMDNTVPLLVVHPPVTSTRVVGLAVAGVCLLIVLWLARPLFRSGAGGADAARIRTLYGSMIVEVRQLSVPDAGPVADVTSMDSLAELAKRYESMIMHVSDPDAYLVWDNGMLYRYQHQVTEKLTTRNINGSRNAQAEELVGR